MPYTEVILSPHSNLLFTCIYMQGLYLPFQITALLWELMFIWLSVMILSPFQNHCIPGQCPIPNFISVTYLLCSQMYGRAFVYVKTCSTEPPYQVIHKHFSSIFWVKYLVGTVGKPEVSLVPGYDVANPYPTFKSSIPPHPACSLFVWGEKEMVVIAEQGATWTGR